MESLNILQLNSSKIYGGGEVHLKSLASGLKARGHNVVLAVRKEIRQNFINSNFKVEVLPLKNTLDMVSVLKLVKIIKKHKIDIVHLHNGKDYWLGIIANLLVKRAKIVATRHILHPLGDSFLHQKLYKQVDRFIAVSEKVKAMLIKKNNINPEIIEVIYNSVDLDNFSYKKVDCSKVKEEFDIDDELVIGVIGRLAEEKNQELLIRAAADLNDEYQNVKYLIIGKDNSHNQNYKKKLKDLIKKFNLEDKFILTGFRNDIPELMDLLDILVVPSKKEAFGLVAIEAMAIKKTVIASRIGGLKEIIEEGISGVIFNKNDKDDLVEKIIGLLDEKKRNFIGNNAYKKVVDNFTKEVMINRVENLYYKLF